MLATLVVRLLLFDDQTTNEHDIGGSLGSVDRMCVKSRRKVNSQKKEKKKSQFQSKKGGGEGPSRFQWSSSFVADVGTLGAPTIYVRNAALTIPPFRHVFTAPIGDICGVAFS